jgi:hypothetical protein
MANNPPVIVADAVLSACSGRFAGWEEVPLTGNRIRRVVYRVLMTGISELCRDKASKCYRHGFQDHSHGAGSTVRLTFAGFDATDCPEII